MSKRRNHDWVRCTKCQTKYYNHERFCERPRCDYKELPRFKSMAVLTVIVGGR